MNGKKVVIWRWYETGQDGKSRERWKALGLASRFKSDAAARQEAERLGLGRPIEAGPRTLKELVDHWLDTECPETDEDPNQRRAFSTRDNYRGYLRKWVKPRWGGPSLGRGEGRGRRKLAFDFEEGKWHSPGRWFEKEDQGPDASSVRARNPL